MTGISEYRLRMTTLLGDAPALRFPPDMLDEGLVQALIDYSTSCPQIKTAVVTFEAAGRQVSLAALKGLITVFEVIFPYDEHQPDPHPLCDFFQFTVDDHRVLHLGGGWQRMGGCRPALAGERVLVEYTCEHTIAGLRDAPATSVPDGHASLVALGAAGYAAVMRASWVIEAYSARGGDRKALEGWGRERLNEYRQRLADLRRQTPPPRPITGYPGRGWELPV